MSLPKRTLAVETLDTHESIEHQIKLIGLLRETYSDVCPTLQNSLKDVKIEGEFDYDPMTIEKIYSECGHSHESIFETGQKTRGKQGEKSAEKSSLFDWNLLKRFQAKSDEKQQREDSPDDPNTRSGSERSIPLEDRVKVARVWEKEVIMPLSNGVEASVLLPKIKSLLKRGSMVPSHFRGEIWRRLLGNRSRINKRLFKLLLAQLPMASVQVKEAIVKDMDRTYSEFKQSVTYRRVRSESVKVLQLFDVRDVRPRSTGRTWGSSRACRTSR